MGKQFPDVDCSRGAPMGRAQYGNLEDAVKRGIKLRLYQVRLDGQGYDDGGAYWGVATCHGEQLYCAEGCDADGDGECWRWFTRAGSREEAAEKLGLKSENLARALIVRFPDKTI